MTRKAILAGATAGLVLLIALAASGVGRAHVLINESPSLPRGLYLRWGERIERGSIVAVGQPVEVRAYLARLGMPAEVLLLKRVAAGEKMPDINGTNARIAEMMRAAKG